MEEKKENKENKLKAVIIILLLLLLFSLLALAGTLIYTHFAPSRSVSVTVPDNIITPDKPGSSGSSEGSSELSQSSATNTGTAEPVTVESGTADSSTAESTASETSTVFPDASESSSESSVTTAVPALSSSVSEPDSTTEITAPVLSLHNRNPEDNSPFRVINMFPGDRETKYFCVRVSYKGNIVLRFRANVLPGYEKLAEVLKCRVVLPESGEVLYDGLMRDMPESVDHTLKTDTSKTSDVYYEITAYLETSVGNEYMNLDLSTDFCWWVEEDENLDSPPTGDSANVYLWVFLALGSLFLLILLGTKRWKEEQRNEQ